MTTHSTLRPGLLVSLKTSISGGVVYEKIDLEATKKEGADVARWETTRIVDDPEEHERAKKARSDSARAVRKICSLSAFGLLCPETKAEELTAAIADARKIADDFNLTAALTRVYVHVLTGRVASDDVEAVKAINSEVRGLLDDMNAGLGNMDVKRIREAASRAKELGQMLSPDAEAKITIAVETARKVATTIAKAGEQAAGEVDRGAIRKIMEMRAAFLDLDGGKEIGAPVASGRAVDFDPSDARRAQDGYQPEGRAIEVER